MNVDENCLLNRGITPFTMDFWEEKGVLIYKMLNPFTPVYEIMTEIINMCNIPRDILYFVVFNEFVLILIEVANNSFEKFIHQFKLPYYKLGHDGKIEAVAPPGSRPNIMLQEYNILQFELPNWSNKGLLFYNVGKTKSLSGAELKQKAIYILNIMQIDEDKVDTIKIIILQGVHIVVQEIEPGAFVEFQKVHKSRPITLVPSTEYPLRTNTCPVCDKQNKNSAIFCGKCGNRL